MNHLARATGLVALLVASIPTAAVSSPPFFFDTTFLDADWTVSVESINGGGTGTGWHNGAGWRSTVNTLNDAEPGIVNTIYVFHARNGATYDPSTSGSILSIEYIEETQRVSGGRQSCGLALRQGGVVYYGPGFLSPLTFNDWRPTTQAALVTSDFDAISPGMQSPNFGATGGVIEFGFYRATSTSAGGLGSTTVGGIKTWSVVLDIAQPVATMPSTWGKVKALYR